ncbi:hypothetical protein IFM89_020605 [Coptis chinensis]|uniref:Uncharacterized protein n=1 Tax=Coptis chinensis TaxID=261450 RepID=A0A835I6K1_9MAGN|nr:hypothetical protein IFM89_020605 [Coptis chinensis]
MECGNWKLFFAVRLRWLYCLLGCLEKLSPIGKEVLIGVLVPKLSSRIVRQAVGRGCWLCDYATMYSCIMWILDWQKNMMRRRIWMVILLVSIPTGGGKLLLHLMLSENPDHPKAPSGRIGADEWLRIPSVEDVFALGDCAGFLEQTGKQVLPALTQVTRDA